MAKKTAIKKVAQAEIRAIQARTRQAYAKIRPTETYMR